MTIPIKEGEEKIAYQGRMIEIVERPMRIGDRIVTFESARRAPGVRLIIPTPDGNILLSKEFRTETDGYDTRLPGGKVFDTLDEYHTFLKSGRDIGYAARDAALKEALEEMGVVVENIEFFSLSKCGATVEWDLYYFVIRSYTYAQRTNLEEGEDISTLESSRTDARTMCLDGTIKEERSALTLLRYLTLLDS